MATRGGSKKVTMYTYYITEGLDGRLLNTGSQSEPVVEGEHIPGQYIRPGVPTKNYTDKNSEYDLWDTTLLKWIPNPEQAALEQANKEAELTKQKEKKWNTVKTNRSKEEFGGFTWNNLKFDSNQLSALRIYGAANKAVLDPKFTVDWTLQDDSVITLTAQDIISVSESLASHVDLTHQKARELRARIDSAKTVEELNLIPDWI